MIIDSHALIYRAYFAFPPNLITSKGELVNAVYGFTSLLLDVINKFQPSNVIAVLDSGEPIERQTAFTQYKANRDSADQLLIDQIPRIEEVLQTLGIPIYKIDGIEADDIIATIDHRFANSFAKTIIVTGDQDLFQLVDDDTFVYLAGRKFSESKLYDKDKVFEKLGIRPEQVPDYKSLAGDSSDNIPGVRGIGPKTACELISKYDTLENIYQNVSEISPKAQTKLIENQEIAYLSKSLATSNKEVPLSINIEDSRVENLDVPKIKELFNELEFRSLIVKLDNIVKHYSIQDISYSLFDESPESEIEYNLKDWDGEDTDVERIYIWGEFLNINENPLHWDVAAIYFYDEKHIHVVKSEEISTFFEKIKDKKIVTHDLKKLWHVLKNLNIKVELKDVVDIGVAGVILGGGKASYGLSSIMNFFGKKFSESLPNNLPIFPEIYALILSEFEKDKRLEFLYDTECAVLKVVVEMERNGIKVDPEFFKDVLEKLLTDKEALEKEIYSNAGHEFNINSPKQVGEILFQEKSLPAVKKTKGGAFSTDERTLRDLIGADPIIENILKYRELDKLLSTYVKVLPNYIDPETKRIHATFDQLGAVSGRFSSKNPNMQNIPKGEVLGINIRNGFVSEEGNIFVSFDYSQQELRILAALSEEDVMVESFNEDLDIHRITAAEIFDKPEDEVSQLERDQGKTINFSIIYGISSFGLSDRMKIPREQASLFIKRYFEKYTKVKRFMDKVLSEARSRGYVETILGRKRYSQTINSNNRNLRAAAEREMFNLVIQGSAADIMKLSMMKFDQVLSKYPAKLLLQIHDEFLFEFKTSEKENPENDQILKNFMTDIKEIMTNAYDLGVKYKVDCSIGTRWGEMKKL